MKVNGKCHCGNVRFTAAIDPTQVLICHCNDCQSLSGSAFRTVAKSEVNGVTFVKGTPKEYIKTAESGNKRAQGFCVDCGSSLYATNEAIENRVYGLRVGALEERALLKPLIQIWCNASQSWLAELDEIKRFDTVPTP